MNTKYQIYIQLFENISVAKRLTGVLLLVQHLEPLPEVHDLDDGRPGDHAGEYRAAGGLHQGRGGAAAGLGPEQRERRGGPADGLPEVVGVRGGQLVGHLNSNLYNF